MKESVTYQAIVEEGEVKEARRMLIKIGTDRFHGSPTPEQLQELQTIIDVGHMEDLAVRTSYVRNWSELLTSPVPPRPRRRKKT